MSVIQDVLNVVTKDLNDRSIGFIKEAIETGINITPDALKLLNAQHNGFLQAFNIVGEAVNWFTNNGTESTLPASFVAAAASARANAAAPAASADADTDADSLDPITVTAPALAPSDVTDVVSDVADVADVVAAV